MHVLDTNVISELMRPAPHSAVFAWVAAQPRASLYTTSITRAEVLSGIAIMPEGRRRAALADAAAAMFDDDPPLGNFEIPCQPQVRVRGDR